MKNFFTILMILTSSFIPFVAFAQVSFVRDLFFGISGSDVFDLQKILNQDSETQISTSGDGSPGNETTYFGILTKNAVEKFQIKYSDYVLKPAGLALPTGYIGQYTRDFLNIRFGNEASTTISNTVSNQMAPVPSSQNISQSPIITSITPEIVSGETKVTITGSNFTNDNTIIITLESRTAYQHIPSTDNGTKIEFDFESAIQKTFDETYSKLNKTAKSKVLAQFPKYDLAVSVITDKGQSNFKTIQFNLK